MAPQITVDLTDLDAARSRLRTSSRPRDHSADNILSSTSTIPMPTVNIQRSTSFKRPQEINEAKYLHRTIRKIERNDDDHQHQMDEGHQRSTREHIYDNFDGLKQKKLSEKSDAILTTYSSSVNMREHAVPTTTARLRPVTMHISSANEKQTTSEFENVFNQLKKRASIKRVQPEVQEAVKPIFEEPMQPTLPPPPPPPVKIDQAPIYVIKEKEPTAPVLVSTNKLTETSPNSQTVNRRRTVGGVQLPGNNKVTTEETKPTPSWIDIAKQKQSKL